ncbi:OPT/YSL family transporter [Methanocella sp. MCL-LM]|uniref:OPT/YSL family transporter n=1 Tax=Methanocella sp. MCL-LM TaxID=3412035 RepID=UPI003C7888B6
MDDRIPAVIVGVLFSVLNAVVTVYLAMKTGMADGIVLLLLFLSFFVFVATGTVKSRAFVYVMAIMMSSTAAVIAYTDGFGAIIISGEPFVVPDYVMAVLLSLASIIGLLLSLYFTDYFLRSGFPWPMQKVTAAIVAMLSAETKDAAFKASTVRMGVAGLASGGVSLLRGLAVIPETIGTTVAGISLSPMMLGIGLLIGFQACLQIALGGIVSLAVLVFIEGLSTDYMAHMRNPWIFSTAISMMVTTAFISLYVIVKPYFSRRPKPAGGETGEKPATAPDGGRARRRLPGMRSLLLAAIIGAAAIILQLFVDVPAWVFLLCIPIAVLFMIIETRGRAEMSMGVGMSSFVVILLVGLAFDNIVPLLILEGFVVAMVMSFSLSLAMLKTAEFSSVDTRGLPWMLVIGSITGSIACIPIIRLLDAVYGIGTNALPAPYSVMWLEMATSAVAGVASPSIDFYLILAGIVIALVLYKYKISAVAVAIGLLLPVSVTAMILAGGILAWAIHKKGWLKDDNGITASGLIAGDILVGLAISLRSLL